MEKLAKRGVPLEGLDPQKLEPASGGHVRQLVKLRRGIKQEDAKKIVALVKESGPQGPGRDPGRGGADHRQEEGRPAGRDAARSARAELGDPAPVPELPRVITARRRRRPAGGGGSVDPERRPLARRARHADLPPPSASTIPRTSESPSPTPGARRARSAPSCSNGSKSARPSSRAGSPARVSLHLEEVAVRSRGERDPRRRPGRCTSPRSRRGSRARGGRGAGRSRAAAPAPRAARRVEREELLLRLRQHLVHDLARRARARSKRSARTTSRPVSTRVYSRRLSTSATRRPRATVVASGAASRAAASVSGARSDRARGLDARAAATVSGVRSSCDAIPRNTLFTWLARSACSRATRAVSTAELELALARRASSRAASLQVAAARRELASSTSRERFTSREVPRARHELLGQRTASRRSRCAPRGAAARRSASSSRAVSDEDGGRR